MPKIKVSIYEDNTRFRESLAMVFLLSDLCTLCGTYKNAINIHHELGKDMPDVLLMDIQMPELNGIEAVKQIRAYNSKLQIIILTVFDSNEYVFDALKAGANGYMLKSAKPIEIVDSVINVVSGGAPMSAEIARKVLKFFTEAPKRSVENYNLTSREKEVLNLLVKGYSYKMIASECFLALDTIRSHIKKIYEKLQVNSNVEAVKKAIDLNIL